MTGLGIGPGDEVITTPFSFIASSNVILYVGATPVFVDIEPVSLNMPPAKVLAAITPKTKAILAVETFGNPVHMGVHTNPHAVKRQNQGQVGRLPSHSLQGQ